jgi:hypothetical protein
VVRFGIKFVEPVTVENFSCNCIICQKSFDPFLAGPYAEQHRAGYCSEHCWVDHLASTRAKNNPPPWARMRAETSNRNLRQRGIERKKLSTISEQRQQRLKKVRELFESGLSPVEIGKQLGYKKSIYSDLRDLNLTQARTL